MTKPSGLMSLLPTIKDPVEDEEQAKAHAIVMQRINAASAALPAARIADQPLVSFTPEFYKNPEPKKTKKEIEDIKFKAHMKKEYGDEAIKRDVLKEIYQNKKLVGNLMRVCLNQVLWSLKLLRIKQKL